MPTPTLQDRLNKQGSDEALVRVQLASGRPIPPNSQEIAKTTPAYRRAHAQSVIGEDELKHLESYASKWFNCFRKTRDELYHNGNKDHIASNRAYTAALVYDALEDLANGYYPADVRDEKEFTEAMEALVFKGALETVFPKQEDSKAVLSALVGYLPDHIFDAFFPPILNSPTVNIETRYRKKPTA